MKTARELGSPGHLVPAGSMGRNENVNKHSNERKLLGGHYHMPLVSVPLASLCRQAETIHTNECLLWWCRKKGAQCGWERLVLSAALNHRPLSNKNSEGFCVPEQSWA